MLKIMIPIRQQEGIDRFKQLAITLPVNYELLKQKWGSNFEISIIELNKELNWNPGKIINCGFDIIDCDDNDFFGFLPTDLIINTKGIELVEGGVFLGTDTDQELDNILEHFLIHGFTAYKYIIFDAKVFKKLKGFCTNLDGWGYEDWVITNKLKNNLDWNKILYSNDLSISLHHETAEHCHSEETLERKAIATKLMTKFTSHFKFCEFHQRWEMAGQQISDKCNDILSSDKIVERNLYNDNEYNIRSTSVYKNTNIKHYKVDW